MIPTRLNTFGRGVPNLVVPQRVLDRMAAAARHYIEDETGEAMVGLVVPGTTTNGVPTLYVLDTISPDESAVRQMHTFQQGDERQDELIWWLQENWRVCRETGKGLDGKPLAAKWNVPLRYLGDWHKQPGRMIAPSGGDLMTALEWIHDPENGTDFLLAPIVTLDEPDNADEDAVESGVGLNYLTVPTGETTSIRVDFWYIERKMRAFLPIVPAVYPDDQLPRLSSYPWHLVNEDRFETESAQLRADKLFTSVVLWDTDGEPPLDVCFMTARLGSDRVFILVTPWDYPVRRPTARVAPFIHMGSDDEVYEVFEQMWAQSVLVDDPPGWTWSAESYLIDYVRALEAAPPALQPDDGEENAR
jgi:hypothetical protein